MPHHVVARAGAAALALAIGGTCTVFGAPAHSAAPGREVHLAFDGASLRDNWGNLSVTVDVATHNSGTIADVAGRTGGRAAGFPAFQAADAPMAVMTVVDDHGADDLSPGEANFRFGADFRLDGRSQGGWADNGNNLIQRGLAGSAMQYKIQVEHGRASCRIQGSAGEVNVTSDRVVESDTWYTVACRRRGDEVVLDLVRHRDRMTWTESASRRPLGTLEAAPRSTPLAIGGKVDDDGAVVSHGSDQFNGDVDDAFVNIF